MNARASLPVPLDVRLMNALASAMFAGIALASVLVLLAWLARLPQFAITGVTVTGDVSHYNAITLRANVMPQLRGNFFTLDLAEARRVFETMPWVRRAVVQRDFPNRLKVHLQEHQAVAYWGVDGDTRLVNSYGEVFEANVGELERDNLPHLSGPEGQSAQVLTMYRALQPRLADMDMGIDQLELSPRGGWRAQLDSGTELTLGAGTTADLLARLQRYEKTITQVTARYHRTVDQLASVDLRHTDGYAIRLEGVVTLGDNQSKKK